MMDLIAAERRTLADILARLTPTQWKAPSLCTGWTVAHVVAHVTMPFRITEQDYALGMQRARGQFNEFSDTIAARDSRIPQTELVAIFRDNADNPWSPPGGGLPGALSHDIIHGLDITRPLSEPHPIADEAMAAVLDLIAGDGDTSRFGFPLTDIELRATDLDWSLGSGAPVIGPGRDLLLLIAGRNVPLKSFSGAGTHQLAESVR